MRLRHSINLAGDPCGRWQSYHDNRGWDWAAVPVGQRCLFRADPGFDWYVLTLRNVELWTIAAECQALGDGQLLADLREGLDLEPMVILATAYGLSAVSLSEWWLAASYEAGDKLLCVTAATAKKLQATAHARYPGLARRVDRVKMLLARDGALTAASGLTRQFFGKKSDPATVRDALQFAPKANAAFLAHRLLLTLWKAGFQSFGVAYDDASGESAVLGQACVWPPETLDTEPLTVSGLVLTVPVAVARGPSWGEIA